jgi:uncharacterized protein YbjT (DUF2867 family)
MILVVGSTGNVGSKIVHELLVRKADFRALVHRQEKKGYLQAQGIDTFVGDIMRVESVRPALEGVQRLYLLSPSSERLAEIESALVDEAKKAGVQHIVKHSVLGADTHAISPLTSVHAYAEEAIKASGIAYTFLRLNSFMQNIATSHAWSIVAQSAFYESLADAFVSHVDTRDVALAAANVLTQTGHEGRTYDITGPEALSNEQIASKLSRLLGRKITYCPIPDEAMLQGLLSAGFSQWYASSVVDLYRFFRQGGGAPVTSDLEQLIAQKPRTIEQYLRDYSQSFQGQ